MKSSVAISEILGIASSSASPSQTPGTLTQLSDDHQLEKLTISRKSVADYFKDRLNAKGNSSGNPSDELVHEDEDEREKNRRRKAEKKEKRKREKDDDAEGIRKKRRRREGRRDMTSQETRTRKKANKQDANV